MPYYVYQITESSHHLVRHLDLLEQYDSFRQAKLKVGEYRTIPENSASTFKIVFADNQLEAEELLQEKRETPVLMEWEK